MEDVPYYFAGAKVTLTTDLTKYHPKLKAGIQGTISKGISRLGDRFCLVNFPEVDRPYDVLYDGLDPVKDDKYKEVHAKHAEKERQIYDSAENIVLIVGPRGGFRYLQYSYRKYDIGHSVSNGDKAASERILKYFRSIGKEIKTKQAE